MCGEQPTQLTSTLCKALIAFLSFSGFLSRGLKMDGGLMTEEVAFGSDALCQA